MCVRHRRPFFVRVAAASSVAAPFERGHFLLDWLFRILLSPAASKNLSRLITWLVLDVFWPGGVLKSSLMGHPKSRYIVYGEWERCCPRTLHEHQSIDSKCKSDSLWWLLSVYHIYLLSFAYLFILKKSLGKKIILYIHQVKILWRWRYLFLHI